MTHSDSLIIKPRRVRPGRLFSSFAGAGGDIAERAATHKDYLIVQLLLKGDASNLDSCDGAISAKHCEAIA